MIASLLASGPQPVAVTEEQVAGTVEAGAHCFLLTYEGDTIGFVELRSVHPEPERSDAAVVVWMVERRPLGIGAAALGFILRYAFCSLGMRELWGWVRQDNEAMLRLCRRLGITDSGTWQGDPDFRMMMCAGDQFSEMIAKFDRLERRVTVQSQQL